VSPLIEEVGLHNSQKIGIMLTDTNEGRWGRETEIYTEQFKKKVTLSHVHNEVTSEPTITRYPAGYRTPFAVESPFCNTISPGVGGPKHFPASITNKFWEFSKQLLQIAWL
jgi:hypothetical protein